MNTLLSQLSNLFLGALPTAVLFAVVWLAYRVIIHGKLVRVLSERRERTAGALEKARVAIAAAEARTAEYEQQIRDAKVTIYKAQEVRRRGLLETRAKQLAGARKAAAVQVQSGRESVNVELEQVKANLKTHVNSLVDQVVHAVLKPAMESATVEVK